MDLYKIACAVDDEADVAAAISELMWVFNLSGESTGEVRIELLSKSISFIEKTLNIHQKKLCALSNALFDIYSKEKERGEENAGTHTISI